MIFCHLNDLNCTFNGYFSSRKIKSDFSSYIEDLSLFLEEDVIELDFKVKKLPKIILTEAKKLLPNSNYVGFSITQGNEYRKKSWSIYKFTALANKVSSQNKVPVFFIEKNNINLIPVEKGFSYNSGTNDYFLKIDEIRNLITKNIDQNFKPI